MVFLWSFGPGIGDAMGPAGYFAFLVIVTGACLLLVEFANTVPSEQGNSNECDQH
jgi:hypothetical protein